RTTDGTAGMDRATPCSEHAIGRGGSRLPGNEALERAEVVFTGRARPLGACRRKGRSEDRPLPKRQCHTNPDFASLSVLKRLAEGRTGRDARKIGACYR